MPVHLQVPGRSASLWTARTRLNSARLAHDDQQHYMSRLSREHEEIYDAIARQDSDAARAAMRLHLTNSRERLRHAHEEAEAQRG